MSVSTFAIDLITSIFIMSYCVDENDFHKAIQFACLLAEYSNATQVVKKEVLLTSV